MILWLWQRGVSGIDHRDRSDEAGLALLRWADIVRQRPTMMPN